MNNLRTQPIRILIVEDQGITTLETKRFLEKSGHTVPACLTSGEEAVAQAARLLPDLILMDINLAGVMDGIEAAHQIKSQFNIPIVYVTAYSDPDTIARVKASEPFGFLLKPFTRQELNSTIEIAIYKHQIESKLRESERKSRTLAENLPDIIYRLNKKCQLIYVSPNVSLISGLSVEAHLGKTLRELGYKLSIPYEQWNKEVLEIFETGRSKELELYFDNANERFYINARLVPEFAANGTVETILGITRDVTQRRRTELELAQRNQELALLNRASRTFTSSLDLDQVLTTILEETRQLLNLAACSVWLIEPLTQNLVCKQAIGPRSNRVVGWRLGIDQGLASWVVNRGVTLVVPDTRLDTRHFKGIDRVIGVELRSMLSVPLKVQQQTIGAINMGDIRPNRFGVQEQTLVESLASSAAIAIENARLYDRIRQDAETKTLLLREVNHRVGNNLAAIGGMLSMERKHIKNGDGDAYQTIITDLNARVNGLATVHTMLSASDWEPIPLDALVRRIIKSALQMLPRHQQISLRVADSRAKVTSEQAHNVALVINELATNTAKYALRDRDCAVIQVDIVEKGHGTVQITFQDNGPGYSAKVLQTKAGSVGLDLVQKLTHRGLRGTWSIHNDQGAVTTIEFRTDYFRQVVNAQVALTEVAVPKNNGRSYPHISSSK